LYLLNQTVVHKSYGEGKVTDFDGSLITVLFNGGIKKFQYPMAFKAYIEAKEASVKARVQREIEEAEEQARIEEEEKRRLKELEKELKDSKPQAGKTKAKTKKVPRENIAFKCNYCDGGKTDSLIGFIDICSEETLKYNIKKEKHVWCSSNDCPCRKYYNGEIRTYRELKEIVRRDYDFVCYESAMLRLWRAGAGVVQTGERKGTPLRLLKVQLNSLAVLTTRLPYEKDENRFIFAVFLVDEKYEGDTRDEGYVTTSSKYKIQMTAEEARQLKFWNYYLCKNAPGTIVFGSGLHRYLSDEQAAQILRDIATIKKGTDQEELAQEFFEYFLRINALDKNTLPENSGALMKRQV